MRIFLTGGTGYLGSAVLTALREHGHDVIAAVRPGTSPEPLEAAGARTAVGQITETGWLTDQLADVDGVIHCASPNDRTSAVVDAGVRDAVVTAFTGSGRPYLHTMGTWVHGSDPAGPITEETPFDPPPIVAWRPALLASVRAAADHDVRSVSIAPGNIYGAGRGIPTLLSNAPRPDGALLFPGPGDQHVSNVNRRDLGEFYALAVESAPAGSYYLAANQQSPTMRELAVAASHGQGLAGRVASEAEAAMRERIGPRADAMLLDQQIDNSRARGLGWNPAGPSLLDELATGSYSFTAR